MNRPGVVDRALSVIGKGCHYKLGAGGRLWHRATPWNPVTHQCDCSGFVAWCLGVDRKTNHPFYVDFNGGWLETTAIVRDAKAAGVGMFDLIPWASAVPSDFLVWPDDPATGRQGHVGIASKIAATGPVRVIHCSAGNDRTFHDAIEETDVAMWLAHGGIVARYAELVTA
jgi:hypothetical protein